MCDGGHKCKEKKKGNGVSVGNCVHECMSSGSEQFLKLLISCFKLTLEHVEFGVKCVGTENSFLNLFFYTKLRCNREGHSYWRA